MNRFINLNKTASLEVENSGRVSQSASSTDKKVSIRNMKTRRGTTSKSRTSIPAGLSILVLLALLVSSVFGGTGSAQASQTRQVAAPVQGKSSAPATPALRFPAYFIEWGVYDRNYVPADIPANDITSINYAFINPIDTDNDGMYECAIIDPWAAEQKPMQRLVPGTDVNLGENLGNFNQLRVLRRNHPQIKVLMSLGGYTLSNNFPTIASTSAQRDHFINSCLTFMQAKDFDGIDVDWEYPAVADRDNFTSLLQGFRTALDVLSQSTGKTYPLTIAATPAENNMAAMNVPALSNILSWVNIMTYDFGGGFDNVTSHDSPLCPATGDPHGQLWNSAGGVGLWLNGGMPAGKINLGLAYYGRAMQHLQNAGPDPAYPGRFAPITAGDYVRGTWDDASHPQSDWTGVFDYWDLKDRFTGPFQSSTTPIPGVNNYTRYWDSQQDVPYVFRPDAVGPSGQGVWMSFDDPQSLINKVNYARTLGLGGVFAWELSQEGHPGTTEYPLSDPVAAALSGPLVNFTCASGGSTPTPIPANTATATHAPTNTPLPPATATRTRTVAPTQTPGGSTATPIPTNTNTPIPTNTSVPTETPVSTPEASPTTTTCDITFSDVPADSTFYAQIRCLACRGIISGYSDGTFRPGNNVTRGQLSKIVSNAAGLNDTPGVQTFQDVPVDSTFYMFVGRMSGRGMIGGYACGGADEPCIAPNNMPYFRPNANATRGQISKIVSNAAGYDDIPTGQLFEDVPASNSFYTWVQRLASRGVMGGYTCGGASEPCGSDNLPYFRPYNNATRGQVSKIVANTFFPNCQMPGRP